MKPPLISILLLTLFACNERAEIIPDNVLSKKEMVSVMVDVQLIEAALSVDQSDKAKETAAGSYDSVLKQHNISREKFDESFKYYAEHPGLMEQIYEEMLSKLSKKQAEEAAARGNGRRQSKAEEESEKVRKRESEKVGK